MATDHKDIDFLRLIRYIREHSSDPTQCWESARDEWEEYKREHIERKDGEGGSGIHCLCGYKNLMNVCHLRNRKNEEEAIVGCCCVKKFEMKSFAINCCVCHRRLGDNNKYVKALYGNGVEITPTTEIVGHKGCVKKLPFSRDEYEVHYNGDRYTYFELYRCYARKGCPKVTAYKVQAIVRTYSACVALSPTTYFKEMDIWCGKYDMTITRAKDEDGKYSKEFGNYQIHTRPGWEDYVSLLVNKG